MNSSTLTSFFLWCSILNYAVLLVWFAVYMLGHDTLYKLHSRWFRISVEQFDGIMYGSMAVYKLGILLLNIVPLLALWILR
jgi:hypothetical protein